MESSHVGKTVLLRNVLFATDFSAASARALPYAVSMARQYASKLYLAHVVPIESYLVGDLKAVERLRQARQEAEFNMTRLLRSASVGVVPVQILIDNGDIWGVLSSFINQYNVDLLVVGTTGHSGLEKVLLGSVAEEAIRESPCPVLTVGPKTSSEAMPKLQKILYASDFSGPSLVAVRYAVSFAEKFRARLTLLHALPSIPESPYLDAQMARVHLNDLVTAQSDLPAAPDVVIELGSPADMILKVASNTAVDLIVIGARGAGAVARLASHFGSIAHKVVSRAHCPVLTVGESKKSTGDMDD